MHNVQVQVRLKVKPLNTVFVGRNCHFTYSVGLCTVGLLPNWGGFFTARFSSWLLWSMPFYTKLFAGLLSTEVTAVS